MKQQDVKQRKLCYSIQGMVEATDFSRSYIFDAIKNNSIKTFKRGTRRFILHKDLVEFVHQSANDGELKA